MGRGQICAFVAMVCFIILQLITCGSSVRREIGSEQRGSNRKKKIRAEAWLFDARIKQNGKPTSFRLEIFRHDSLTAISGRGYLGKGGMKGLISDDTLMIYFPISNEFVWEPVSSLLFHDDCTRGTEQIELRKLLHTLPKQVLSSSIFDIKTIFKENKAQAFVISSGICIWSLELHYDRTKVGWRLKRFIFDDGDTTVVKGERRKFRPRAKIPLKRFQLTIPPDAFQLHY